MVQPTGPRAHPRNGCLIPSDPLAHPTFQVIPIGRIHGTSAIRASTSLKIPVFIFLASTLLKGVGSTNQQYLPQWVSFHFSKKGPNLGKV